MIPATDNDVSTLAFQAPEMTSNTFCFDLGAQRVRGFADKREAMRQAIYLMIFTERYTYPIYSWNYGAELGGLIGQPIPYVLPEIKRRVTEALMQDDRITGVDNWEFDVRSGVVGAAFTVRTIWGDIDTSVEVNV